MMDSQAHPIHLAEIERLQASCELHDGILQYLIAAKMQLEALPCAGDPPDPRLRVIDQILDRGIREGREWIGRLRGESLALEASINQVMVELCEEVKASCVESGLRFTYTVDRRCDELPISPEVRTALYRIAQEALRNVQRHSRASCASLRLAVQDHQLLLEVVDDGQGFDPANPPPGHYGVLGMMARAQMTGGRFSLRSARGAGTSIEVAWTVA